VRGLTFTLREAGTPGGEVVVLLHGFPETSLMWEPLMRDLAGLGYHVVAPDQRGYSDGARPPGDEAYSYEEIARDVLAIGAAFAGQYHLVGHDWGALAGWVTLATEPTPIRSWTALSCPHYRAFAEAVYADGSGAFYRSMLAVFLNADGVPAEDVLTPAALDRFWTSQTPETREAYRDHFANREALTGALNWYRASRGHRRVLEDFHVPTIATPTLFVWGHHDPAVGRLAVDRARHLMTGPYHVAEMDAGHWVLEDDYRQVRDQIVAHLRRNPM
jgi:pimeloyl-ACP methyl ester carboxylesterase